LRRSIAKRATSKSVVTEISRFPLESPLRVSSPRVSLSPLRPWYIPVNYLGLPIPARVFFRSGPLTLIETGNLAERQLPRDHVLNGTKIMYMKKALQFLGVLIVILLLHALVYWNIDLSTWTPEERSNILVTAVIVYVVFGDAIYYREER
jgi:hypothetical protein